MAPPKVTQLAIINGKSNNTQPVAMTTARCVSHSGCQSGINRHDVDLKRVPV